MFAGRVICWLAVFRVWVLCSRVLPSIEESHGSDLAYQIWWAMAGCDTRPSYDAGHAKLDRARLTGWRMDSLQ